MTKTVINREDDVWLAAAYHMPSTYTCRIPMSSMSSSLTSPTPGPATVRLALIRTAIELFGFEATRDVLFPIIRSAEIRIKPPHRIGISIQNLKAYKASSQANVVQSIVYREIAHCEGHVTIFLKVPASQKLAMSKTLKAVSYWGQASSFTGCLRVIEEEPMDGEWAIALADLQQLLPLENMFTCFVTEFAYKQVEWESIVPILDSGKKTFLKTMLLLWPLVAEQQGTSKLLRWRSLEIGDNHLERYSL